MRRLLFSSLSVLAVTAACSQPAAPPAAAPASTTATAPKLGIRPYGDEEIKPDMSQVTPELAKVFDHRRTVGCVREVIAHLLELGPHRRKVLDRDRRATLEDRHPHEAEPCGGGQPVRRKDVFGRHRQIGISGGALVAKSDDDSDRHGY